MTTRKALSLLTASAILAGSLSGCALLGGKDKKACGETVTSYVEAVSKSKFGTSKKYVLDGEDYFLEHELDGQTWGILEALWGATEFELGDIEVNKNSATVEVEFTFPDLESIADEGYSYDEFIDAIADADTTEETFEFELSKDDDEWFIEADSTEDFYNFLVGLTEDLEFSGLSEDAAIEAVATFIDLLASGDVEGAQAMSTSFADTVAGYASALESSDYTVAIGSLMGAYFSHLDYVLEVTEIASDAITVTVTGTAPDAATSVAEATNDPDALAPVVADYLEGILNNDLDMQSLMSELFNVIVNAVVNADLIPYSSYAVVTCDEDGNLLVDPDTEFMPSFEFDGFMDGDEVVPVAAALLLEQGRITPEQYAALVGDVVTTDYDVTHVVAYEGDDYYNCSVFVTDDTVTVHVQTWDYYDEGDVFAYNVIIDGYTFVEGEYEIPYDNCDIIDIDLPVGSSGPYGDYLFTVYNEGGETNSELTEIEVIVLADGAPVPGELTANIESLEEGDDLYSYDIVYDDENIYAYVRTWDYYDEGTEFAYVVTYMSGTMELAMSDTYVMTEDNCDTIVISLPQAGNSSWYNLVVYDADVQTSILGEFEISVG